MSATLEINQLRVGMFIHLDLGWWAHPFAVSSFAIASAEQIETIRGLGLKQVRWSPEKSLLQGDAAVAAPSAASDASAGTLPAADGEADAAQAVAVEQPELPAPLLPPLTNPVAEPPALSPHQAALAERRVADALCLQQYSEAGAAWQQACAQLQAEPAQARKVTEGLSRSLLSKLMVDDEMCVRVLSEGAGEGADAHALNVAVISLLLGRVLGLAEAEMQDLGVGALLHDVGKLQMPARVRFPDARFSAAEQAQYRDHVALGVAQGKRMGLSTGALLVLAQHHEMVDGSGFPLQLKADRMVSAARIVSLVNRYDNLCNPPLLAQALTPHEALSMIFSQSKSKFDAQLLNAFIRMMGVYPPGSYVQLSDDRYAAVLSVNSSRPLKPRVLVCDPRVPADQALPLNLETQPGLGVRRSVKPAQLPAVVQSYLSPRARVVYFFEPVAGSESLLVAPGQAASSAPAAAPIRQAAEAIA